MWVETGLQHIEYLYKLRKHTLEAVDLMPDDRNYGKEREMRSTAVCYSRKHLKFE